jgi:ribosomal protein L2
MSSGSITYVPTSTKHQMFQITQLRSVFARRNSSVEQLKFSSPNVIINQAFFLIKQLPKNQPVSLLEILPNKGVQYARSTGTSARIVKMDSRISTGLIKLPSGVKKVFSTYAIGSVGSVSLPENKK